MKRSDAQEAAHAAIGGTWKVSDNDMTSLVDGVRCRLCKRAVDEEHTHRCGDIRAGWNVQNARAFNRHIEKALERWQALNEEQRAIARLVLSNERAHWRRWLTKSSTAFLVDDLAARAFGAERRGAGYNMAAATRQALRLRVPPSNGAFSACMDSLRRLVAHVAPDSVDLVRMYQAELPLFVDTGTHDPTRDFENSAISVDVAEAVAEMKAAVRP